MKTWSKRIFILGVLLGWHSLPAVSFSGLTLGGELGYGVGSAEYKKEDHPFNVNLNKLTESKIAPSGVVGQIAVGYNLRFSKCWVLGFDGYAGLSALSVKDFIGGLGNSDITTKIKMNNSFGLRVRPGILVAPKTLIHGTLGAAWSQWKVEASKDADNPALFQEASSKKRVSGFSFGGGMLTQVTSRFAVGVEFTRTLYKKFVLRQPVTPAAVAGGAHPRDTYDHTVKPSVNTIAVRVVYSL